MVVAAPPVTCHPGVPLQLLGGEGRQSFGYVSTSRADVVHTMSTYVRHQVHVQFDVVGDVVQVDEFGTGDFVDTV